MSASTLHFCSKCGSETDEISKLIYCTECERGLGIQDVCSLTQLMKINLYLIRHSESCANVMKRTGTKFTQHWFYDDPELSARGIAMAKELSYHEEIAKLKTLPNTIFGSSILLRAQQTAEELFGNQEYVIFPYLREKGWTQDNLPNMKLQKEIGKLQFPHNIYFYDTAKSALTPSFEKFKSWLGCNIKALQQAYKLKGNELNLVIVSHGNLLRGIAKQFGQNLEMNNLDMIQLKLIYTPDGANSAEFMGHEEYLTTIEQTIQKSCSGIYAGEKVGCRKKVCAASGGGGRTHRIKRKHVRKTRKFLRRN